MMPINDVGVKNRTRKVLKIVPLHSPKSNDAGT